MAGTPGIASALETLAGLLEREKGRGLKTVPLDPAGLALLRQLPDRIQERKAAAEAALVRARPSAAAPDVEPHQAAPRSPAKPTEAPANSAASAPRDEASRRRALIEIFQSAKRSPEPRALGTLFDTLVFATGSPMADVVFVGEAPGAEEEKSKPPRQPFVGPAGQKLDQILKAMGLSREKVYISNIVKFRPKIGDGRFQHARNRPPSHEEMAACLPFIRAEIAVLQPKVVVALGRTAAEGLLERGGSLASFRNAVHHFDGTPVVVTYHPSYLLRQESASPEEGMRAKRQIWEDMLRVMDLAGMPISERQRGYFQ